MDHLRHNQVGEHPVHYITDFITEEEESALLRKIATSPAGKWRNLSNRRYDSYSNFKTNYQADL